ncbi:MFS transporter, partial [Streptococcus pneumoniae]|nr:MFS transporter [Streptococcus pneumoniae]
IAGLALTGAGVGATMSVASTAIVGNVPVHRAGMASSVEEVSYEFGSLFAVTILGSLLAYLYTVNVVFPAGTSEAARDSMASALVF